MKQNNIVVWLVLIILILLGAIGGVWWFNTKKNINTSSNETTWNQPGKPQTCNGVVEQWDYKTGTLIVLDDASKKTLSFKIGEGKTMVVIPVAGNENLTQERFGVNIDSPHWASAFCKGDLVVVATNEQNEVVMANNLGFRMCGIRTSN